MIGRTLSEFNQSLSRIKNLAGVSGGVILTNGGKPDCAKSAFRAVGDLW